MGPRRGTEKREKRPVCQLRFEAAVIAAAGEAVVTASLSFPFFYLEHLLSGAWQNGCSKLGSISESQMYESKFGRNGWYSTLR